MSIGFPKSYILSCDIKRHVILRLFTLFQWTEIMHNGVVGEPVIKPVEMVRRVVRETAQIHLR